MEDDAKDRDRWQRTWDLFHQALERGADERSGFLDAACATDPELRAEVDRLLGIHQRSSGILDAEPAVPGTLTFGWEEPLVDRRIGPYHLQEVVGEGGMGVVYSAQQTSPVRRRVALKLVRPGMDSQEVLARFESERQALAILDHPRIAKVYDAGVTDDGRPYFVMEYVPGIPLTEYCDLRGLGLRERLELFRQACEAIDHAHGKGIIHRDIKPSNLLVAAVDGKPSLKVIDFGVAKATNQRLTERTLFTRQGVLVGTPGYMSPEQAGTTPLEVDARADVYALGVVLYELLAGAQPFDPKTLRNVAIAEMLRIIREEDPPPPWARLTSLGARADEVAKRRHLDVHTLVRRLQGELEWITMRALDKDATRRYASAADLAEDLRRHLGNEPVQARPPRFGYRVGKFVRRHRAAVIAAAVFATVVAGLGAMLTVQSSRLSEALDHDALRSMLAPVEGGVAFRELWSSAKGVLGTPSPDGSFISFTDWSTGDLAVRDLASGEERRLTGKNSWSTPEFAEYSAVSPDGREVAYAWFTGTAEAFYQLRVISVEDSAVRVLIGGTDTPWVRPVGWTADGSHVLTWMSRESGRNDLVLVPAREGETRVLLSSRDTDLPGAWALSPDDGVLLYSVRQQGDSAKRDIRLRRLKDGHDVPLVEHAANDVPLAWSPDGRHVLFTSDRTGSLSLWAVAVNADGADGDPVLIRAMPRTGVLLPMGFTSRDSFVYAVSYRTRDVFLAAMGGSGEIGAPQKMTERYEGTNHSPDWSPDGKRLTWISERDGSFTVVTGSPGDDELAEVPVSERLTSIGGGSGRWSPDGTALLVTGQALNMTGWQGVFSIDVASGKIEQIAAADSRGILRHPRWSPDGGSVYFLRRSESKAAIVAVDPLDPRRQERIVHETDLGNMAVSPDGRWIAYTTDAFVQIESDGPPTISVVSTAGGEASRVFEASGDAGFGPFTPLAWSADSEHVYFGTTDLTVAAWYEEDVELMRVARIGGEAEPLGLALEGLSGLRVHPEGSHLAFDAGKRRAEIWSIDNLLSELDGMRDDR
jgi:serine/threonine protein kinase